MSHIDRTAPWLSNTKVYINTRKTIESNLSTLVEWCSDENFKENAELNQYVHSDIVKNCFLREYVIRDLPVGQKCYVRVSAGNLKGFGPSTPANPPYCVPSSNLLLLKNIIDEM